MLNDYIHSRFASNSPSKRKLKLKSKKKLGKDDNEKANNSVQKHKNLLSERIKEKICEFIGHIDHAPDFLKDNEFIHTGYRINFHTPQKVLKSLFMLHNESMNIWTHLGGAIALIVLCLTIVISVNSINAQNLKQFGQVQELFEPLYDKLEHDFSEKFNQTKEEILQFREDTILKLEFELESLSNEIENVKENINPEAIGKLLTTLEGQLTTFSETSKSLTKSVHLEINKKKLLEISSNLKHKLSKFQDYIISKIDSSDLDWIDVYRYINPDASHDLEMSNEFEYSPVSRWPIIVFLMSAVFCLLCSSIFHLFYCQSYEANQFFKKLDYAGISILITGSCFPAFVYGFACQPFYSTLYLSIIGVTSIIVFFVSLTDWIHSEAYWTIKNAMYGGLGIFAGLPMLHLCYLSLTTSGQSDNLDFLPSFPYYVGLGASYLGGLAIYTAKCPERFHPGKFDILGHSHQIWHMFVLMGIIFTYFGAFDNYYTRMQIPCLNCE